MAVVTVRTVYNRISPSMQLYSLLTHIGLESPSGTLSLLDFRCHYECICACGKREKKRMRMSFIHTTQSSVHRFVYIFIMRCERKWQNFYAWTHEGTICDNFFVAVFSSLPHSQLRRLVFVVSVIFIFHTCMDNVISGNVCIVKFCACDAWMREYENAGCGSEYAVLWKLSRCESRASKRQRECRKPQSHWIK